MNSRLQMLGLLALVLAGVAGQARSQYVNVSAGGPLRPGVYGRIEIGTAPPPPLIFKKPLMANQALVPAGVQPLYFYVPPGQARKWAKHCRKYNACGVPVYFVRMDDSPSKLGKWKKRPPAVPQHR